MEIESSTKPLPMVETDSIVFFVTRICKLVDRSLKELDQAANGAVTTLIESAEFTGREGEVVSILCPKGYLSHRVILVGLGARKSVNHDTFRRAGGTVSRFKGLTGST